MKRSRLREHIFALVFMMDFHPDADMASLSKRYLDYLDGGIKDKDREYIEAKFLNIVNKLDVLDATIAEKSEGWGLGRMGRVELALIRLAAYEILYDEDVPTKVAINEAVELSKRYGQDDSPSFVNGILAKLV
ncbi:MAG: transcription antitermination factor NusB [Lachnospiraceae bacterium]|nr:transcription antitermination factor NusB [Lachnospiraceae bacterium]